MKFLCCRVKTILYFGGVVGSGSFLSPMTFIAHVVIVMFPFASAINPGFWDFITLYVSNGWKMIRSLSRTKIMSVVKGQYTYFCREWEKARNQRKTFLRLYRKCDCLSQQKVSVRRKEKNNACGGRKLLLILQMVPHNSQTGVNMWDRRKLKS